MRYKGNHFDLLLQTFSRLFSPVGKKIGLPVRISRKPLVVRLRIIIKNQDKFFAITNMAKVHNSFELSTLHTVFYDKYMKLQRW
jgi:hypothetical protein